MLQRRHTAFGTIVAMPRDPRCFRSEGVYHLTAHGIDDRPIFRDDVDRQGFAIRLRRIALREAWSLYAACLLGTHYHLVLRPFRGAVAEGLRVLNGGHSRAFNRRHVRRGALFESRYRVQEIRDERHLEAAVRYVEGNAVLSGLVAEPGDWPWSTYPGAPLRALLRRCLTPEVS